MPVSKIATSVLPCPTFLPAVRSSPGSSVVVMNAGLGAERVGQPEQVAARVVGGQAEGVEVGRPDEREVHHLDEAVAGERAPDPAAQLLRAGEAATRRAASGSTDGTRS